MQEQALVAGMVLGFNSISSREYMGELVKGEGQPFLDEKTKQRIKDIIIINNEWQIYDSINEEYLPTEENGETKYRNLSELTNLPPLMEDEKKLGADINYFPNVNAASAEETDGEAHAIPIQTTQGRWYVMVILENDKKKSRQPCRPTACLYAFDSLAFNYYHDFSRVAIYAPDCQSVKRGAARCRRRFECARRRRGTKR